MLPQQNPTTFLWGVLRPHLVYFFTAVVSATTLLIGTTTTITLMVGHLSSAGNLDKTIGATMLVFITGAVPALHFLRDWAWSTACSRIMEDAYARLGTPLLKLPQSVLTDNSVGAMCALAAQAVSAIEEVGDRFVYSILPICVLIALGATFTWSCEIWTSFLFFTPLFIGTVWSVWHAFYVCYPRQRVAAEKLAVVDASLIDTVMNHDTVQSYATHTFEARRHARITSDWRESTFKAWIASSQGTALSQLTMGMALALPLTHAVVFSSDTTVVQIVSAITPTWLTLRLYMSDLGSDVRQIARGVAKIEGALAQLIAHNHKETAGPVHDLSTLSTTPYDIAFHNVTFQYPNGKGKVLTDLSMTIKAGTSVAFVGTSGSGKTTIARLISGAYSPTSGTVTLGGLSTHELTRTQVAQLLVVIPQVPSMFNRTLYENIAYGIMDVCEDKLDEAVKAAHVEPIIAKLPDGYYTVVGDGGIKLSGGERQRVAIARALVSRKPTIIFDEATSALDTLSERQVQQAIRDAAAEHTVIIIAHRLSTIRWVDRIIVVDKGRIVEDGTHDELLVRNGHYAALHHADQNTCMKEDDTNHAYSLR